MEKYDEFDLDLQNIKVEGKEDMVKPMTIPPSMACSMVCGFTKKCTSGPCFSYGPKTQC